MKSASITAALAWATGAWASLGVVAVMSQSTTARAGLLPPVWVLAALAVGAAVVVTAFRLSRDDTAPLWLALVAWLPWIPGPIPAAILIFDGPLSRVVVVLAAALVIGRVVARSTRAWTSGRTEVRPNEDTSRRHLALAFAIAVIASGLAAWRLAPILPEGDEPHYLVITQSLLYDGDLQIENNHQRGDYAAYAARLRPDFLKRGRNGQIYSIHAPGLPALVLPAFAAGGYPAVVVFLVLLFGVASALTWRAAYQLTGDATSTWLGWAGVMLSAPAFFHSFTVYPDGPAALVVIGVMGLRGAEGGQGGKGRWLLAGAAIAALPWLHTRLALVAIVLLAVLALRILVPGRAQAAPLKEGPTYRHTYDLVALFAVPAISVVLWLAFFYVIYGTIDPRAPYGGRDGQFVALIPRGLTGLLVDQQFGLLPNAPIYAIALAGLLTLWRTHKRLAIELAAIAIPYILVVSANEMWWAGFSAPARLLVPVLLPMALPLAAWWQRHDSRVPRAFALVALGASLAITTTLAWTGRGALLYNGRDGFALWLDLLAPAVSLARAEPTAFRGALAATWIQAAMFCAAAAACWWALIRIEKRVDRPDQPPPRLRRSAEAPAKAEGLRYSPIAASVGSSPASGVWILTTGAAMSVALVVAVQLAWTISAGPAIEAGSSELRLLAAACGPHLPSSVADRLPQMVVPDASRRPPGPDRALWMGQNVAPGRYDLMLSAISTSAGTLTVALGRPDTIVATCEVSGVAPGAAACEVDLPAGAESLWIEADSRLRTTVSSVGLMLNAPPSPAACDLRARRAVADGGQVLYVTDGLVYAKRRGVWVLGGAEGHFVASGTGETKLRLQNGPVHNHVAIWNAGWRDDWDAQPGAFRDVQIPRSRSGDDPAFTVASAAGFESAVDSGIGGHRSLGVWVSLQDFGKPATSYSSTDPSRTISGK